jgi:hypothetical protein
MPGEDPHLEATHESVGINPRPHFERNREPCRYGRGGDDGYE